MRPRTRRYANNPDSYEIGPEDIEGSNPHDVDRYAYYGPSGKEFVKIVDEGIRTSYHPDHGRGVLFTTNPHVARALSGASGQVLRFPFPANGTLVRGNGPYRYNHFTPNAVSRSYIEVFLDGDLEEDLNWAPIGSLRS